MTEHTPGPWQTVPNNAVTLSVPGHDSVTYRIVWAPDGGDVAYVVPCGADTGNADARLIAAAPNLLEACKEALAASCKNCRTLHLPLEDCGGDTGCCGQDIRGPAGAAIALAEGRLE